MTEQVPSMVTEAVELVPSLRQTPNQLDRAAEEQIKREALQVLGALDPILQHIMDIKLVRNERRNLINVRIKSDYTTLLFQHQEQGVHNCFFLSDKLEPFITITVVHPARGKLNRLTSLQLDGLNSAVRRFKDKYGITGDTYHYTTLGERGKTDELSSSGQVRGASRSHSSHFHLKMRVATDMYKDRFPVLQLINLDALRVKADPVRYQFSRDTKTWEEVWPLMQQDVVDDTPPGPRAGSKRPFSG
mmetsp:Transcript_45404/g.120792  ORF Transcript_45404/g.120792 Transcript_45404/m.120792 type:complete len:246 (+) Transcript_45404:60-797(+)